MRPAGSTAVCSTTSSPAPDSDNEPRCCRCQSLADPSSALYWHIGDTAMWFARVIPPRAIGSNKRLAGFINTPRRLGLPRGYFPASEIGAVNARGGRAPAPRIAQAAAVDPRAIVANAAVHPVGLPAPPNASSAIPTATGPTNAAV